MNLNTKNLTYSNETVLNDLRKYTDTELLQKTITLVQDERKLMSLVLEHLKEIELRRLYAKEGYSSLFEYCQKILGYSESEAFHRISAMRLMKSLPEVKSKLESGEFTLSTLSLAQKVFKREKEKFKLPSQKRELLNLFQNQSKRQCERIAAEIAPTVLNQEQERPLTSDTTELRVPISQTLLEKLNRLKSLTGKSSYADLLEQLATEALLKKDPDLNRKLKRSVKPEGSADSYKATSANSRVEQSVAPVQVKEKLINSFNKSIGDHTSSSENQKIHANNSQTPSNPRFPALGLRRAVKIRDHYQCSFIHPSTHKRCEAKSHLQIDHIIPWSEGGKSALENLRLLCTSHHALITEQYFGRKV